MGAPYSKDFVETVREAADLVQVVSEYVPLKASGSRLKGLCPFHEEKTPSFGVDPSRQLFYCFGCQAGGDVFKFVQLYESVGFRDAAELLARRFGVPLPTENRSQNDPKARMFALNRAAEEFFRKMLADPHGGQKGRHYLEKRKLGASTVEALAIGFAPDRWDALEKNLASRGFRPKELIEAGLAIPRKSGSGQYDRFRDRLIFPIQDYMGRPVAFGGRILGDGEPKYLNSPETPAYTKGDHLYGLNKSGEAIRKAGYVVVVEGYMDLAALWEAGIQNVVAVLGTAFTPAQAKLLARFADRVVFSFDGDGAGAKATVRSMDLLLERGFQVSVVDLPKGADPDDFIKQQGADAYRELVDEAPEYLEFLVRREARSRDLAAPGQQVEAVNAVLPHIARLGSGIERSKWAGRLADGLNLEDDLVLQELRNALKSSQPQAIRQRADRAQPLTEVEGRLIILLLGSKAARDQARNELAPEDLDGTRVQRIVKTIFGLVDDGHEVDYPAVHNALDRDGDRDLLAQIAFREEPEAGPDVSDCVWSLQQRRLTRESRQAAREIDRLQRGSQSSAAENPTDVNDQLARLQELARQRDAQT